MVETKPQEKRKGKRRETGKRRKDRRRNQKERAERLHDEWKADLMRKSKPIVEVEHQ